MWSLKLTTSSLLSSLLLGDAHAASVQARDELACQDVDISQLRDPERAAEIWHKSGAGIVGDNFISDHGIDNWVQDLDQEIFEFGGDISQSWDCFDLGTECNLGGRKCYDYVHSGHGIGAYFLYYSLQQFKSFLNSFHERLQDTAIKNSLHITQIQDDFKRSGHVGLNIPILAAGAMNQLSSILPAGAGLAGGLGFLTGTSVLMSSIFSHGTDEDPNNDAGGELATMVEDAFENYRNLIDEVNAGVFGKPNVEKWIPPQMIEQDFNNDAIGVLANGQWLRADPTEGLEQAMDDFTHRMRQALAWAMIRHSHKSVLMWDGTGENDCGQDYTGAVWLPEEEICLRLMSTTDGGDISPASNAVVDLLLEDPYNLDLVEVYQNAYECAVKGEGKPGNPEFNGMVPDGGVPPCFFGMKVIKGKYKKNGFANGDIQMKEAPELGQPAEKAGAPWDKKEY